MEVKIKSNCKLIDAKIEIVDGVMIVSPADFKPTEGQRYYYPRYCEDGLYRPRETIECGTKQDSFIYNNGMAFPDIESCQEKCDKLNK